ncbi:MAG TPA: glutamyl-tRNA reductase, partial [Candidatus Thermoplasmatota archaeon]|nr:glutamyl-tRNA reductase [Candidatus Thermoplasmatota archaeon]
AGLAGRRRAALAAEALLADEARDLDAALAELRARDVLRALYGKMAEVRAAEVQRALRRLHGDAREREVLEGLADSLVNKLLAAPTAALKRYARARDAAAVRRAAELLGVEPDAVADSSA